MSPTRLRVAAAGGPGASERSECRVSTPSAVVSGLDTEIAGAPLAAGCASAAALMVPAPRPAGATNTIGELATLRAIVIVAAVPA